MTDGKQGQDIYKALMGARGNTPARGQYALPPKARSESVHDIAQLRLFSGLQLALDASLYSVCFEEPCGRLFADLVVYAPEGAHVIEIKTKNEQWHGGEVLRQLLSYRRNFVEAGQTVAGLYLVHEGKLFQSEAQLLTLKGIRCVEIA